MMKCWLSPIVGLLVLVSLACGTAPEFKFQYVCINRVLDSCVAAEEFAKRVSDRTNGRVEIEIASFRNTVGDERRGDTLRLMKDGTLGLAEIYSGFVVKRLATSSMDNPDGLRKDLAVLDMDNLWGMYPDYDTQQKVTEAIREDVDRIVEERSGGVVLAYQFYPSSYFFAKKPLRTAGDFKDMVIRGAATLDSKDHDSSTVQGDLLLGMGALTQFVHFASVYSGLLGGNLDAAVSCGKCGSGLRWYEVAGYLVGPIVALPHTWITMNRERWDELPPDLQAIIRDEAKRHEELTRENALTVWNGVEENEMAGMEYIGFTPELRQLSREAALNKVLPNWVKRVGGPDSKAVKIFNEKVSPILNVEITALGKVRELE